MKIKTLKVVGFLIATIFMMVAGLVFAAGFAVEQLQSWPKALMEARVVLYGQVVLGMALGTATGKWKRWVTGLCMAFAFVSTVGYGWALTAVPISRYWFCLWGMLSFISVGGMIFGAFMQECLQSSPKAVVAPPRRFGGPPGDASLN